MATKYFCQTSLLTPFRELGSLLRIFSSFPRSGRCLCACVMSLQLLAGSLSAAAIKRLWWPLKETKRKAETGRRLCWRQLHSFGSVAGPLFVGGKSSLRRLVASHSYDFCDHDHSSMLHLRVNVLYARLTMQMKNLKHLLRRS